MKSRAAHGHRWLVGVLGLAISITLTVGFPKLKAVAGVVLLVGFFHLIGITVVLGSVYSFAPARIGVLRKNASEEKGRRVTTSAGRWAP